MKIRIPGVCRISPTELLSGFESGEWDGLLSVELMLHTHTCKRTLESLREWKQKWGLQSANAFVLAVSGYLTEINKLGGGGY
jgi:hypothetical protein